jgi:hypothetical protein
MPDLVATRGDTNIYNVTVLRGDKTLDITGAKVWMTAKHFKTDADQNAVFQVTSDTGDINIYDPANGRVQINVQPFHTDSLLEDEVLYYDIQLKESTGQITTIGQGKLEVLTDVTQATT